MPLRRKNRVLTHERLLEVLDYDPETGIFVWRVTLNARRGTGERAGWAGKQGKYYPQISIDCETIRCHYLAWFYVHGVWPTDEIDHINTNIQDYRIANLREATSKQNKWNSRAHRGSYSGYKGVERSKGGNWTARICTHGVRRNLGTYSTPEEAHAAYCAVALAERDEFARVA